MGAGEEQCISSGCSHSAQHAVGPGGYLVRRLASRTAIAKNLPVGAHTVNLRRRQTFILTIVPFEQVGIDFSFGAKTRQVTGSVCALQRTCKYSS